MSGLAPPRSSWPASTIRIALKPVVKSRRTSAWCRGSINPVKPIATAASPNEATHWPRTILVECAWASLRYNPWAKGVYERICGKQKTRKKKAGIALARKIAVIAWAMLRDEKDWEPKRMIEVTESYGRMSPALKESLQNMKPKENSDQRKSRLRKEARAAKAAAEVSAKTDRTDATDINDRNKLGLSRQVTSKPQNDQLDTDRVNTRIQTTASRKASIAYLMPRHRRNESALLALFNLCATRTTSTA